MSARVAQDVTNETVTPCINNVPATKAPIAPAPTLAAATHMYVCAALCTGANSVRAARLEVKNMALATPHNQ